MKESSRKRLTMEDARREVAEMEAEKDALYDSIREEAFRAYETGVIPSYLLGSEKEWLLKEVLLEMADIQVNDFKQLADRVSSFYDSWEYFNPSMLHSVSRVRCLSRDGQKKLAFQFTIVGCFFMFKCLYIIQTQILQKVLTKKD